MKNYQSIIAMLVVAGAIAVGCSKGEEESTAPEVPKSNGKKTGATTTGATTGGPAATPTFASLQPLIQQKCVMCHGDKGKGGIDLRTYDSIMKGGAEGPIVTPGDPDNSVVVQALRGKNGKKQMPFKQPPLSEDQIKQVEDWIRAGAKA